jgi:hypothetical protein
VIILDQDTAKKKSPIVVEDRQGFDDSPVLQEKNNDNKVDKRSPFGVAEVDADKAKEKAKKKKEKNADQKKSEVSKNQDYKSKVQESAPLIKNDRNVVKFNIIPKKEQKKPLDTIETVKNDPKTLTEKKREIKNLEITPINTQKPFAKTKTETKKPSGYLVPQYRNFVNQDGLFLMFLMIGLLFGWINIFHRKRFVQVLNAFFVTRIINQLIREENSLLQRVFIMVSVIFILILSIFVFQTSVFFNVHLPGGGHVLLFFACALIVSIVYFSKFMIVNFAGYLFDAEKLTKDYFYNIFLVNNFVGLLFVPLVLLIAYTHLIPKETLIMSGGLIYLLSFTYRVTRGFVLALNGSQYSVFHIFLYLCTLEILPLFLLIKLIKQSINF